MALSFDLAAIPLKYVALPVVVAFAAGTGALAAYVTNPAPAPVAQQSAAIVAALPATSAAPPSVTTEQITPTKAKKPSCEEQTWPYIDNRCIARKGDRGDAPARAVRLVGAPRDSDGGLSNVTAPKLVTSDGVLRGPGVAPEADGPKAKPVTPTVKKAARRSDARRQGGDDYRRVYSVYSVPSGNNAKPVIVVRPMGIEQYSSRF